MLRTASQRFASHRPPIVLGSRLKPCTTRPALSGSTDPYAGALFTCYLMRKSKHPDWDSSSFYLPSRVNIAFNKAILDLKLEGHELDRSDVLTWLIKQWAAAPYPVPVHIEPQDDTGG